MWEPSPPQPAVEEVSEETGKTKMGNVPRCPWRTAAPFSSVHSTPPATPHTVTFSSSRGVPRLSPAPSTTQEGQGRSQGETEREKAQSDSPGRR